MPISEYYPVLERSDMPEYRMILKNPDRRDGGS
jgi:hypothetical protein